MADILHTSLQGRSESLLIPPKRISQKHYGNKGVMRMYGLTLFPALGLGFGICRP